MKTKILTLVTLALIGLSTATAQVGIGTTTPDPSAELDVDVSNLPANAKKGFLPPRLTTNQRDGIANPAEGLTIYNTDSKCLEVYAGLGWRNYCDGTVSQGPVSASACDNDVSVGSGTIVGMKYDYDGDGIAEYNWCAREITYNGVQVLDRNLGAFRVATAVDDEQSYGDLYQWGRAMDGHHKINWTSSTAGTPANGTWNDAGVSVVNPNDTRFIEGDNTPGSQNEDWMDNNPDGVRWDANGGNKGVNDPCPTGYKVPTETELDAMVFDVAGVDDLDYHHGTNFKMSAAGGRDVNGFFAAPGFKAWFHSQTTDGTTNYRVELDPNVFFFNTDGRAFAASIRCVKE